jgi:hypothetical protein
MSTSDNNNTVAIQQCPIGNPCGKCTACIIANAFLINSSKLNDLKPSEDGNDDKDSICKYTILANIWKDVIATTEIDIVMEQLFIKCNKQFSKEVSNAILICWQDTVNDYYNSDHDIYESDE